MDSETPTVKKRDGGDQKKKSPLLMVEVMEVYKNEETFLRHSFAGKKIYVFFLHTDFKKSPASLWPSSLCYSRGSQNEVQRLLGVPDTFSVSLRSKLLS